MNRVISGVENLEKLVGGGIPKRNMVLVSGSYGTGKTTLALQFIANGISELGELGVFVTFVDDKREIMDMGKYFGWQLKRYLREGLVDFLVVPPSKLKDPDSDGEDLIKSIEEKVKAMDADRLAIDGLDEFSNFFEDKIAFKSAMSSLRENLRENECTSLLTSQGDVGIKNLVDGVLVLHYEGGLEKTRAVEVKKMRRTDHTDKMCPFEIMDEGIVVTGPPKEEDE